jgi:methylenetetrahydrofolate dehydrogenase (NADP+)/methenyltetrahydrofolate cyclohydrolase
MAQILSGKDVAAAMNKQMKADVAALKEQNILPKLAIIRVGEREDDISYEKGAAKRADTVGVAVQNIVLPADVTQEALLSVIETVNQDQAIHGVLLFRPLPKHIDDNAVRRALLPEKDVDGITDGSMVGVYTGEDFGFPPCTPQACMEILDYYGIDVKGKNAVVIGRSLVVGKPAAMMLLKRNATVTVCHTKTNDMPAICRGAEILIVSAGRAGIIGRDCMNENQIVLDVGINVGADGKLCGDVDYAEAEPFVKAITPVPGGVGTVTTSVLIKHVVETAKRRCSRD